MNVVISPDATKQFNKLPHNVHTQIIKKLRLLEKEPFAGKLLQRDLRGFYSLKAWPYRIIYSIYKKESRILVTAIQHRQGVYK